MRRKVGVLVSISPFVLTIACSFALTLNIFTTTTLKSSTLFLGSVLLFFILLMILFYFLYLKSKRTFLITFISSISLAAVLSLLWYPILFNRPNKEPGGISSRASIRTDMLEANTGFVTGTICYPSDFVPAGKIISKNILTNKVYTQEFEISVGKIPTYKLELPSGKYHLKYEAQLKSSVINGYYSDQTTHDLLIAEIVSGKTITNVDLCDYYYGSKEPIF